LFFRKLRPHQQAGYRALKMRRKQRETHGLPILPEVSSDMVCEGVACSGSVRFFRFDRAHRF
jgi:hypothetical protein